MPRFVPPPVIPPSRPVDLPKVSSEVYGRKDRSPLRQSFRNLISVFKKGKAACKDKFENPILFTIKSQDSSFVAAQTSYVIPDDPLKAPIATTTNKSNDVSTVIDASRNSYSSHSGPLLYLSRLSSPLSSPILPVWTTCTATLHVDHILITRHTTQGNPSTQVISLSSCTDVRSLASSEIDPEEKALLPRKGDAEDLRVFEILFEGRPREKFAAISAQERAGWVSAIW